MNLQQMMNSPLAIRFISHLARGIPPRLGYPLCDRVAGWLTSRDSDLTRAVRSNQWVVRGANLAGKALDAAVHETLRNNARDIYSLYHFLQRPEAAWRLIHFTPPVQELMERPEFSERGLIILGLHLSNFDLVLRTIASRLGFKATVLTLPDPQGGRRVEYEMRKQAGMNLVPASVGALRGAIKHLENGGMLVTGLDRPVPDPRQRPLFFGRPSSLPTHYVYLALKARVPIVVMAVIQQPDGKYHLLRSGFIEMESDFDHEVETMRNTGRVLKEAEKFIKLAPQQWNVPLPVWPNAKPGM
jgi:KDO2-lipid IV(A) lauroyltransferase